DLKQAPKAWYDRLKAFILDHKYTMGLNTLTYVEKAGTYRIQLDENWFTLDANLLREALEITPIDQALPFVSPPSGDAIMDFVNELGYLEGIITSANVEYVELMWEEFVQAMQTFLTDKANLDSPTNDVWSLVPPLKNQTVIGTKWVFKNKLDENGVVSRNKARLVAQGYNQ
ncbi:retrovirus-related pol polyprotein from transposon TNT 1-94, partial [Tanacetum coccineum]